MTGLPNLEAFHESDPAPYVAKVDADNFKAINDLGQRVGDEGIKAIANALKEAGLETYHVGGDEFYIKSTDKESDQKKLEEVAQKLENTTIRFTDPDTGEKFEHTGVPVSFGFGENLAQAEKNLNRMKGVKLAQGKRTLRKPETVPEVPSAQRPVRGDIPSEGQGGREPGKPAGPATGVPGDAGRGGQGQGSTPVAKKGRGRKELEKIASVKPDKAAETVKKAEKRVVLKGEHFHRAAKLVPKFSGGWKKGEDAHWQTYPESQAKADLEAAAARDALPLPPETSPEAASLMNRAWGLVSRLWPEMAQQIKTVQVVDLDPKGIQLLAAFNHVTRTLSIVQGKELAPGDLWHELVHAQQKMQGRLIPKEQRTDPQHIEMEREAYSRQGQMDAAKVWEKLEKALAKTKQAAKPGSSATTAGMHESGPAGWDKVGTTSEGSDRLKLLGEEGKVKFDEPLARLSDSELQEVAQRKALPLPPGAEKVGRKFADAWRDVSRFLPELAGLIKEVRLSTGKSQATLEINPAIGLMLVGSPEGIEPGILWHELVHVEQYQRGMLYRSPLTEEGRLTAHGRLAESEAHQRGNMAGQALVTRLRAVEQAAEPELMTTGKPGAPDASEPLRPAEATQAPDGPRATLLFEMEKAGLDKQQQDLMLAYYLDSKTFEEIAEEIGISKQAVEKRHTVIIRKLAKYQNVSPEEVRESLQHFQAWQKEPGREKLREKGKGALFSGFPLYITALEGIFGSQSKLVNWVKKLGTPEGFPDFVHQELIKKEGEIRKVGREIAEADRDLRRAVKQVLGMPYEKLSDVEAKMLDDALHGDPQAKAGLPNPVAMIIEKMRQHIDYLSRLFRTLGIVEGEMVSTFDKNDGVYVHRSYQIHTDPKWSEKIPADVRNRAKDWMRIELQNATEGPVSDQEVNDALDTLLFEAAEGASPMAILAKGKLGSKDLGILRHRKELPFELREFLGERHDVIQNYALSVSKMIQVVANHKFLTAVVEQGKGTFFFDQGNKEHPAQIADKGNYALKPLAGLYTTPEIAQAFSEFYAPKATNSAVLSLYYRLNAFVKASLTIYNPAAQVRNLLSWGPIRIASGHLPWSNSWKSAQHMVAQWGLGDSQKRRNYLHRAVELGVIGEEFEGQELNDLLDRANDKDALALLEAGVLTDTRLWKAVKSGGRIAQAIYRAGDDFPKLMEWESNKNDLRNGHPAWSEAKVEEEAAKRNRQGLPYYGEVPQLVKAFGRAPGFGQFVRWSSEMIRVAQGNLKIAAADLQTPGMRLTGARRLAGMAIAGSLFQGAAMFAAWMLGIDDDEREALRNFAAPWARNSTLIPVGRDEKGNIRYIDTSFSDPFAYLKKPLMAFMQGKDTKQALISSAWQVAEPFLGEEVMFGQIVDVLRNKQGPSGLPVFNKEEAPEKILEKIAKHLGEPLVPGGVRSGVRIYKGFKGAVSPSGNVYDPKIEIIANVTGQRIVTNDTRQALYHKVQGLNKSQTEAKQILDMVANRRGMVTDKELIDAYKSMELARKANFTEMNKLANSAMKLNLTREQVATILVNAGVAKKDVENVLTGVYKPFLPTREYLEQAGKRSALLGKAPMEDFQRRRDIIRALAEKEAGIASGENTILRAEYISGLVSLLISEPPHQPMLKHYIGRPEALKKAKESFSEREQEYTAKVDDARKSLVRIGASLDEMTKVLAADVAAKERMMELWRKTGALNKAIANSALAIAP